MPNTVPPRTRTEGLQPPVVGRGSSRLSVLASTQAAAAWGSRRALRPQRTRHWKVVRTLLACLFFGAATVLQFQLPALGVNGPNALLTVLPSLLVCVERRPLI